MRYVVSSLFAMIALGAALAWNARNPGPVGMEPMVVACAAGLKPAVEELAQTYEARTGVRMQLQYGGSQTLLAHLEVSGRGDVFIPADDDYLRLARDKGLIEESVPLVRMSPVLGVARGNPRAVRTLDDITRADVRLALASPETAAIGRLVRERLRKAGAWEAARNRAVVVRPTVGDAANDVKLGAADVAFLWDATVAQMPDLEAVHLPAFKGVNAVVAAGVVSRSPRQDAARAFVRFLASPEGAAVFTRHGYQPARGD